MGSFQLSLFWDCPKLLEKPWMKLLLEVLPAPWTPPGIQSSNPCQSLSFQPSPTTPDLLTTPHHPTSAFPTSPKSPQPLVLCSPPLHLDFSSELINPITFSTLDSPEYPVDKALGWCRALNSSSPFPLPAIRTRRTIYIFICKVL